ncbi:MAG TPA: hypothetical protein VNH13_08080 [Candidatus Acidoferrales bacterium]|jgi:hypothetical protein|nr:hypothetical protein [Candidatus Acidoferrales bacterium]
MPRRLAMVLLVFVLAIVAAIAGCDATPPPTRTELGAADARAIAIATFTNANHGAGVLTNVVAIVERTPGMKVGPNAGRDVWTVRVIGTVTDANGSHYDSAFWIEVDPATGVATVLGRG